MHGETVKFKKRRFVVNFMEFCYIKYFFVVVSLLVDFRMEPLFARNVFVSFPES